MKIYKCNLEPHDFLFFVSRDLAKVGVTEKIIHSTALNYAVNHTSRIMSFSSQPKYPNDVGTFQTRVTPAYPLGIVPEICFSYNAVSEVDISTEAVGNYPTSGKYYKIGLGTIQMAKGKKNFKFTSFEFFVFSFNDLPPRRVIQVGKKDNYCIVKSEELTEIKMNEAKKTSPITPSHPINPLEFEGTFADHFPISILSIPPHLLIISCRIAGGRYIEATDKKNKRYLIIPPKDKIKEISECYGHN